LKILLASQWEVNKGSDVLRGACHWIKKQMFLGKVSLDEKHKYKCKFDIMHDVLSAYTALYSYLTLKKKLNKLKLHMNLFEAFRTRKDAGQVLILSIGN